MSVKRNINAPPEKDRQLKFASSRASGMKAEKLEGVARAIELALSGDIEEFDIFLSQFPDMVNARDEGNGCVSMHVAASKGNMELAAFLIRKGANLNIQDIFGNTPLHYAIDKGNTNIVGFLMRNGCNFNLSDYRGNSPLHSAAKQNSFEVVKMLLNDGADPDAMDFANERATKKTSNVNIINAIDLASQKKKEKSEAGAGDIVNWMGFGIGLGVGLGVALAKQQQFYIDTERIAMETRAKQIEELKRQKNADFAAAEEKKRQKKLAAENMRRLL